MSVDPEDPQPALARHHDSNVTRNRAEIRPFLHTEQVRLLQKSPGTINATHAYWKGSPGPGRAGRFNFPKEDAVVETDTVTSEAAEPSSVTMPEERPQTAPGAFTVQPMMIVRLKPISGVSLKEYVAVWPGVTLAFRDDEVSVKSGPQAGKWPI